MPMQPVKFSPMPAEAATPPIYKEPPIVKDKFDVKACDNQGDPSAFEEINKKLGNTAPKNLSTDKDFFTSKAVHIC